MFLASHQGHRSGALANAFPLNAEHVQNAQEQVGAPLGVVREHEVAIPRERPVDPAEKNGRHLLVRVSVRVTHVATLVDQYVIQQVAVAVGSVLQLPGKVRQVFNVIAVDQRVARLVRWYVSVMRDPVPATDITRFRERGARKIAS